ncbi:uncharacterized protein LOC110869455 isoform X3 [Helianthus annuus]|uniref:uncharacterized protein LOC110869455 isoform X3 n=1 Tax=Helianthus annuus TaxID=4232 RepID=UPI001652C490|nr:uncharacterized protein LOC110869455 isoform X3 [Helianthus annuus]
MESVLSFYLPPCLILLSQHPNADLDSGNCCFMLTTISIDRGLLTMDLRFGDVIDDAARYFKDAYNRNLAPYKFVEGMIDRTIEKLWPNNPMLACDSSCQSNLTLILNVNNNLCNSIVSASMALSVYSNPLS